MATASKHQLYTVRSGDTLWSVAKKLLGSSARYTDIVKLNGIKTATLYAGQTLKIPASEVRHE